METPQDFNFNPPRRPNPGNDLDIRAANRHDDRNQENMERSFMSATKKDIIRKEITDLSLSSHKSPLVGIKVEYLTEEDLVMFDKFRHGQLHLNKIIKQQRIIRANPNSASSASRLLLNYMYGVLTLKKFKQDKKREAKGSQGDLDFSEAA